MFDEPTQVAGGQDAGHRPIRTEHHGDATALGDHHDRLPHARPLFQYR